MVIVRHLLQRELIASRREVLRGFASAGSLLALGGCAGLAATGASFDASSLSVDPTLLVATTRKPVNGGRAKPWFGSARAHTMTLARAKLVPPELPLPPNPEFASFQAGCDQACDSQVFLGDSEYLDVEQQRKSIRQL